MASASHDSEHGHHSILYYVGITAFLGAITFVELGPLFGWFHIPALGLLALSVVKFFVVIAFFMHLWDDASIFTKLFAAPLIGALLMVIVLMTLHHSWTSPSPGADYNGDGKIATERHENLAPLPLEERHADIWSGDCFSWLKSHATNRWYCASPPIDRERLKLHIFGAPVADDTPNVDLSKMSAVDQTAWLMKHGEEKYNNACASCHQKNGEGVPGAFPPLKGGVSFYGEPMQHARIIVYGMSGPIRVNGADYNGAMPAQHKDHGGQLSTLDIAAIATYERNTWGNADGNVMPADVDAAIKAGKFSP